jgi:hypothetical protein
MAKDQDFLIVRRFGYMQVRVLLSLQDQLVRLEEELDGLELGELDKASGRRDAPMNANNGSSRNDPFEASRELIETRLHQKLRQYSE